MNDTARTPTPDGSTDERLEVDTDASDRGAARQDESLPSSEAIVRDREGAASDDGARRPG